MLQVLGAMRWETGTARVLQPSRGRSLVVKPQPSKLMMRVRFPPPASGQTSSSMQPVNATAELMGLELSGQLQHFAVKTGSTLAGLLVRLMTSKNPWVVPRGHDAFNEVLGWG
jgi:hypothetical protein